ncbi:Protein E6, partial [Clarias magur]
MTLCCGKKPKYLEYPGHCAGMLAVYVEETFMKLGLQKILLNIPVIFTFYGTYIDAVMASQYFAKIELTDSKKI